MSNIARVAGQAANTLSKPLNVEEVFSTYLYEGNGSTQTITNGIDLAGEGGLVWVKWRSGAVGSGAHVLVDTERGVNYWLSSSTTSAQNTTQNSVTSFNSNGFSIVDAGGKTNYSGDDYTSWTFRKAPKFFDVVTYTGDGVDNRTIAHNLGSVPGMIIVKSTSSADQWPVYHRSLGTGALRLNLTNAYNSANIWWKTTPTDSVFTVYGGGEVNVSGVDYVAYLFAHNDGDGGFGPNGDADIIKCGSVTYTTGATVDLGFEPQWVLVKPSSSTGNWILNDVMRGMPNGSRGPRLDADTSGAELANATVVYPTSTGFTMPSGLYTNSTDLIYIAIRRGPMAVPESATEVFTVHDDVGEPSSSPLYLNNNHVIDAVLCNVRYISGGYGTFVEDRLRDGGNVLKTNATDAETSVTRIEFDHNTNNLIPAGGYGNNSGGTSENNVFWQWKRAPNFFDVVAYTGNSTAGRTVSHNLGVAPEMIWVKNRSSGVQHWRVYHSALGATKGMDLNQTVAAYTSTTIWNDTEPTSSVFTVGTSGSTNNSGSSMIAYLFASLDGVSKVGSYTGNGTSQTIDCGFSSGARFVLIKSSSGSGGWFVFDIERGITSNATDGSLQINETHQEYTETEWFGLNAISPDTSGFTVEASINSSGVSYIFYAIA